MSRFVCISVMSTNSRGARSGVATPSGFAEAPLLYEISMEAGTLSRQITARRKI
jgi:hypothetical protein